MIQTKVAENWISDKKLSGVISLSTHEVELGGSKDLSLLKYYNILGWECRLIFFDQIILDWVFSKSRFLTLCLVSQIVLHFLKITLMWKKWFLLKICKIMLKRAGLILLRISWIMKIMHICSGCYDIENKQKHILPFSIQYNFGWVQYTLYNFCRAILIRRFNITTKLRSLHLRISFYHITVWDKCTYIDMIRKMWVWFVYIFRVRVVQRFEFKKKLVHFLPLVISEIGTPGIPNRAEHFDTGMRQMCH